MNRLSEKRHSRKWKDTDSLVEKKFCTQWSVKKIMVTFFWDMQQLITFDFPEKGATVKISFYCQPLLAKFKFTLFIE